MPAPRLPTPCLGSSLHRAGHVLVRGGSRCVECTAVWAAERPRLSSAQRGYGSAHRRAAAQVLSDPDAVCWLCGGDATPSDPLVADHVVPMAYGGDTGRPELYEPAHRSCNSARGGRTRRPRREVGALSFEPAAPGDPRPSSAHTCTKIRTDHT